MVGLEVAEHQEALLVPLISQHLNLPAGQQVQEQLAAQVMLVLSVQQETLEIQAVLPLV
jgi:hypothetical protein